MIIVDFREDKQIINKLKSHNIDIKIDDLEVGDYLLPNGIAIERKERDILQSISSGRIWEQMKNLSQYEHPILCIITQNIWKDIYYTSNRNIHKSYFGAISTIIYKFNIPVLTFQDKDDFITFLITLHNKSISNKQSSRPKPMIRKPRNNNEILENIIAQIPGISINKAKRLLSKYHTIKDIMNASTEDISKIEGFGKKTIFKIREILNHQYDNL